MVKRFFKRRPLQLQSSTGAMIIKDVENGCRMQMRIKDYDKII